MQGSGKNLDGATWEACFAAHEWAASTQNRKQTAIARFCRWSRQHGGPNLDSTRHLERPKISSPHPRGLRRDDIERIFAIIPAWQTWDTLLFRLVFETGLRISEALNIHLDDRDLARGDKHLTVLLDDPRLVNALRKYLRSLNYEHGPLFRAQKNGRGGITAVSECAGALAALRGQRKRGLHLASVAPQPRDGTGQRGRSLGTIRKRLGHRHIQTTLCYAEVSDASADAELRIWRRRQR